MKRTRHRIPRGSLPCANVCFLCGYMSLQDKQSIGFLVEEATPIMAEIILLQLRFRQILLQ